MGRTRINSIFYEKYAIEGSEVILFGTESGRPIGYALDISVWSKLKMRLLMARLNGNPIRLLINNKTNKIIDIFSK